MENQRSKTWSTTLPGAGRPLLAQLGPGGMFGLQPLCSPPTSLCQPPPPQPSSASSPPPAGSHSLLPRSPSHPHPLLSPDTLPIHSPRPCQDLASSLSPAQQGSEVRSLVLAAPGPRTEPTQPLSQAGLGWAAAAAGGQAEAAGSRHFPIKQIRRLGCLGGTSAGGFGKGLEPGEKRSSSSTSEKAF